MDIVAIRRHLLEAIEVSEPLFESAFTIDVDVALEAIAAGMVLPDDNDGLIPPDDLDQQYAFGAVMSDGPWWVPSNAD